MNITFLGAAREVTGSCYLVETTDTRFLVDCGMVQGGREAPARNRKPFAFDPKSIDFVLLTHAHIDHSGLLPKLTRAGFQGPIYSTAATADLLQVMLPDSAHIQEGDAKRAERHTRPGGSRDAAATPLYTLQDARDCLRQVRSVAYDLELTPHAGVRCRFRDAGHILGSATLGRRLVEGAKRVRIFGEDIPVRAGIHTVGGLSAHADRQALLAWTGHFRKPPGRTFVVHGEVGVALAFADTLRAQHGWDVTVPESGTCVQWEGQA